MLSVTQLGACYFRQNMPRSRRP